MPMPDIPIQPIPSNMVAINGEPVTSVEWQPATPLLVSIDQRLTVMEANQQDMKAQLREVLARLGNGFSGSLSIQAVQRDPAPIPVK
jgi:hypothetical protein